VAEGRLAAERLESYHKLVRELEQRASWENRRLGAEQKRKVKVEAKARGRYTSHKRP
jgi:hypothetical protein